MAFAVRNLSVLSYANGFTQWHYKADKDTIDQIVEHYLNYFMNGSDMLTSGDIIMINGSDGAAIRYVMTVDDRFVALGEMT
jgi:hypothetical protein